MLLRPETLGEKKFWNLVSTEVAQLFEVDSERGLSSAEVEKRLSLFGRNVLHISRRTSGLQIFLSQLKSPLILILIAAGVVTLSISHYRDAIFIFIAVIVNSVLGFYQENKADRALAELKTYLKQRARVVRDGIEREIDAEELVPGDILRLSQGDRVPADGRVIFTNDFQVDEAVLTGESLPVSKTEELSPETAGLSDQNSMVFAGTLVTQGVCTAVVCRTDDRTEFGRIAEALASAETETTPLQKSIVSFSIMLSVVLGLLTVAVFILGIAFGRPVLEMFLTSVAIAVSAIPEGLPVSMTVILAVGVERMAKRKGVVRRLVAAEALGSTTTILTDKTGTLTLAKMVMSKVIPFGIDEKKLLKRALTNAHVLIENPNDDPSTWRMNGKIMDVALVQASALRGISLSEISGKSHVLQSLPFNPVQKFSAALVQEGEKHLLIFFGAPDILLSHSDFSAEEKREKAEEIASLAFSGERVLGVATKEVSSTANFAIGKHISPSGLSFNGLIAFHDPIRPGIKSSIELVRRAGIRTVIMTGDYKGTAVAVAREVGLDAEDGSILDASELVELSDEALSARLPSLKVISRVTPFDKLRIAKLYQARGEIVAMTGDGVNDAPAIKQADVGIAMGSGTEVAQSVADLVLLDDNFETIVAAIEEGRQILGNIRKVLVYLLSNVLDSLILIGGSLALELPLPLTALQILWVNFFSDSFPAIAFAFEKDSDKLSHAPNRKRSSLFNPLMRFLIVVIGISTSALLFVIYWALLKLGYDEWLVQTFTFAAFGTYTLLVAFPVRSFNKQIFEYPLFSNRYLTAGIVIGILLMAGAIYMPLLQNLFGTVALPFSWVLGVLLVGMFNVLLIEVTKRMFRRK